MAHYEDENAPEFEEEEEALQLVPRRRRQQPLHQRESPLTPGIPQGRLRKALTIGVIAGILCTLQHNAIVLVNASTYQEYSQHTILTIRCTIPSVSLFSVLWRCARLLACLSVSSQALS